MLHHVTYGLAWLIPICVCLITLSCNVVFPRGDETILAPADRCDLAATAKTDTITVATFNIQGGRGDDGVSNLVRTAGVVAGADFVGLQETGKGHIGDLGMNHAGVLADLLHHSSAAFFPVSPRAPWDGGGAFGNGFTTSLPIGRMEQVYLPALLGKGKRGVAWVEARVGSKWVNLYIVHLTATPDPAGETLKPQLDALLAAIDARQAATRSPEKGSGTFSADSGTSPSVSRPANVLTPAAAAAEEGPQKGSGTFLRRSAAPSDTSAAPEKGSGTFSPHSHTSLGMNTAPPLAAPRATGAKKVPDPVASRPLILMGDFNAAEAGPIIAALRSRYREVLCDGPDADAPRPPRRDYLFVSPSIEIVTACLVENDASDHPALLAVLRVPPSNE